MKKMQLSSQRVKGEVGHSGKDLKHPRFSKQRYV